MENTTVIAKLKTAHLTIGEIRNQSDFGEISDEDAQHWLKAYQCFDGMYVYMRSCEDGSYCLIGCSDAFDEQLMMAVYHIEQDSLIGTYQDDLERFKNDWQSDEYSPDAALYFPAEQVEVIQMLQKANK